jgi:integrative and conjugative element protein (TIGR02256 family)
MIYQSPDLLFGLELNVDILEIMLKYISSSGSNETGGILIGNYISGLSIARVMSVSGPPEDSRVGPTWFQRGTKGLSKIIEQSWKHQQYYLGEWHFHPNGLPMASNLDINQMTEIANSKNYHCPEPILIILGGNIKDYDTKAFVILKNRKIVELKKFKKSN